MRTETVTAPIATGLLAADDPEPFEIVNPGGRGRVVLLCEHAGRAVPAALGDLGIAPADFDRHIAWDIGADAVSRRLSSLLDAPLVSQPYCRLVVDCNRSYGVADCFPEISDTVVVPANAALSEADRRARFAEIHSVYHEAVSDVLDARPHGGATVLVSIHSFTPRLAADGLQRPWEIGLLFNRDDRLARRLMASMKALRPELNAAFNEPYFGSDLTDYAIPIHGERRGIEHVLIEIRNDLISTASGQADWAVFIGEAIRDAVPEQQE
ncbi:N-formylglutamate amidohydrolase [Microbaculum marinum]|uniref:N-formylglutamate amidohydrolase n=1 Tax=Microbaculum marinum TaxID=1764581 RepID=A0AAW9RXN3_9HYPH